MRPPGASLHLEPVLYEGPALLGATGRAEDEAADVEGLAEYDHEELGRTGGEVRWRYLFKTLFRISGSFSSL